MDPIETLLQRPKLYNNIDGVGELSLGLFCLGCGALDWLQSSNPASPLWHGWMGMVWFWSILAVVGYGARKVKERVTYRRTGYVEYRSRKQVWLFSAILGCVVGVLAAILLRFAARSHWNGGGAHGGLATPAALLGLAFAAAYAYGIARFIPWKRAVAVGIAIASVIIAMLPAGAGAIVAGSWSPAGTLPAHFGVWMLSLLTYGAILLLSGAVSFCLYLRRTAPPAAEAQPPAEAE